VPNITHSKHINTQCADTSPARTVIDLTVGCR
jgi:hypothetical protein